ncbi:hypothetical protein [Halostella litorea]|uniref:hypothetical protein n=1 Tax=Halostella litorea TaxID=2528831 RepID=UPI001091EEFA|nr:hypothetical protein [Halostella litorea]
MTEPDLREHVERARAAVADAGDLSLRNTELRLVQPLLAALGWDVHGPAVTAAVDVAADRDPVNYALSVDGRPAVFVDVVACGEPLREADVDRLDAALAAAGVDRGLLTNGRSFVFVGRDGSREECRLDDLPDRPDAVAPYTRSAAESRVGTAADRRAAADRIAARRDEVAADVTDRLVGAADGAAADDLAAAVDRFLDDLLAALAGERPDSDATDRDGPATERRGNANGSEPPASDGAPQQGGERVDAASGSDSAAGPTADDDRPDPASDEDSGEYVVRFFSGRTSVGAVGTDTPVGATAAAVEYLIERHALAAGLTLPWRPDAADDDGRAVLNHDPMHPNGAPMEATEQLANGYHLLATLDAASARTVVAELADEAGLRPMFQGDW